MQQKLPRHINTSKKSGLFNYLLLLTTLFILIELSLFIQSSELYLGDFQLVADHLKIPRVVLGGIFCFIWIQLLLHLLFTIFIWGQARLVAEAFRWSWKSTEKLGFGLWLVGIILILTANQISFPNSKFAQLTHLIFPDVLVQVVLFFTASILGLACVISGWNLANKIPKLFFVLLTFLIGVMVVVTWRSSNVPLIQDASTQQKPNIILIGIDSLRPDFLGYFGYEKITPHLDHFLSQATVFSDALTPIARTFPSWVSILTGQYPKHSGIRFNLAEMREFNWHSTLPYLLQNQGYKTIFATDETRFSNIDKKFGFDQVVTPPIGFNDFLLGTLNDFPLANLLVNSSIGRFLLPYSYGNRAAFTTYSPDTFLTLLKPALMQRRTQPTFLAVHFCLPHFPYFWGNEKLEGKSLVLYQAAVQRVDRQFQDFLSLLKESQLLTHSIVIVLSDHGEAIELPGDRATDSNLFIAGVHNKKKVIPHFYPKSFDNESINQSAGHGTDILGLTQYHTVLAIKLVGLANYYRGAINTRVSLLDIKPTVLDFLKSAQGKNQDGVSLKQFVLGNKSVASAPTHFFMETDFSPQAIRSTHPNTRDLLFAGINFFQINPETGRLTVKDSMGQLIISSKQYADIYGDWILALYPQSSSAMTPILLNLKTGEWTDDLQTPFAKASPGHRMMQALHHFYGNELHVSKGY